ncbi:MAG: YitT family protein [Oscillospiraceae bacterium]|nr:YitT family protein [Oscillospiraceae bacterium]
MRRLMRRININRDDWLCSAQFILGVVLMSASYPLFFLTNDIAPGGLSGVAMILNELIRVPVGMTTFALNVPLFAIGFRMRGTAFVLRSFAAMTVTSALIDWLPLAPLTADPMLAAVGGGALLGVGLGFVLRANATTGGTDMAAMLLHKRFPLLSIGGMLMAIDCLVIIGAAIVFEPQSALYSLVTLYLSTRVMDRVVEGFDTAKAFFIISNSHAKIASEIMKTMERGVTLLNSRGGYSGEQRDVLLCVITRTQIQQLKRVVHSIDPKAFMIVTDVSEAMGEGFGKFSV